MEDTKTEATQTTLTSPATEADEIDVPDALAELPAVLNGWVRDLSNDQRVLEFWREKSTHILGTHERLAISQQRDGEYRLTREAQDQYGHRLSTEVVTRREPHELDWLATLIRRRTDRYPGEGTYDGRPTYPTRIGNWSAVTRQNYQRAGATRWVYDPVHAIDVDGEWSRIEDLDAFREEQTAVLTLKQTDMVANYSHTKRAHSISYWDREVGEREIASGIPRTSAHEMVEHSLRNLKVPVSQFDIPRERLQRISGIGPAKSADFLLLGLTNWVAIQDAVGDESELNHHIQDRVEALLTDRIREEIGILQ